MKNTLLIAALLLGWAFSGFAQLSLTTDKVDIWCHGQSTGTAWVTASGGTAPYTYFWSAGTPTGVGDTIVNLAAGTYMVTVVDDASVTDTASVSIFQHNQLTLSLSTSNPDPSICPNNMVTVSAFVTNGVAPYTYTWSGAAPPTAGGAITIQAPMLVTVTVTDAAGCAVLGSINVQPITTMDASIFTTTSSCGVVNCLGASVVPIVVGQPIVPGPFSYEWSNAATDSSICNLSPSTLYTVTITNSGGCTATASYQTTSQTPLTVNATATDATCTSLGSATVSANGGIAPFAYQWSNGANSQQIDQLIPGTYRVTVVDNSGCVANDSVVVGLDNTFSATLSVSNNCQGTICITANAPVGSSYVWSNFSTAQQICVTASGSYNVTVSSSQGCTVIESITVTTTPPLSVSASSTAASCGSDGSVAVSVSDGLPPYTVLWSTNDTTLQVNNLPASVYTVSVTDANGCQATATATVANGNFTIDSVATTKATCSTATDGSATILVSGSNPPFTYLWNNSQTTATAVDLAPGTYKVTVSDANGCLLVQTFQVTATTLQINSTTVSRANCDGTGDGAVAVAALNGKAPFTYQWSNNATTDTLWNLPIGGYTVTVTDDNGCTAVRHQFVTPRSNCFTRIGGKVYADMDNDCAFTLGDIAVQNFMVRVSPGYNAITDNQGNWKTVVRIGSYDVFTPLASYPFLVNACGIDTVNLNIVDTNTLANVDFPLQGDQVADVKVTLNCGIARPGFANSITVTVSNLGIVSGNVTGTVVLDPIFTSANINPPNWLIIDSITYGPTTVHFSIPNMAPQTSRSFAIATTVPLIPIVSLGQTVQNSASIDMGGIDNNPANNYFVCSTVITGSYDPNDKQVFNATGGSVNGNAAIEDTLLHYLIRFQNTGTDTAFNITVRDTLDSDLNISSFRFIAASHDVVIEFYEERIVHFVFNNILLPDSNVNEPGSHGFIEFDIEVLDKEALEEVTNQAAIYFDFNPPIYTNTVATQRTVGIAEKVTVPVNVFPNPTTGLLSVNLGGLPVEQVELYDLMGKLVLSNSYVPTIQAELNATGLGNGLYVVRIRSGAAWYMDKVIIAQ